MHNKSEKNPLYEFPMKKHDWVRRPDDCGIENTFDDVNFVGGCIANLISLFYRKGFIDISNIEFVGHGVGAHIAGIGMQLIQ